MSATKTPRWQLVLLAGVLAILAGLGYMQFGGTTRGSVAAPPAGTSAPPSNQAAGGRGRTILPVSDVRLDALTHDGSNLASAERNPFRFEPKATPPPPRPVTTAPPQAFTPPPVTGPPPPPAIPLKYVGLLGAVAQRDRVAVLSDPRGNPFYGREGDIIEGRYRVLRIAADSVDLAYADGRGRQTLRLSAQ
jgi:hypothetical protein